MKFNQFMEKYYPFIIIALLLILLIDAYSSYGKLRNSYNNLVEKHNNLVEKYNLKSVEVKDLKLLMTSYQDNLTELSGERDNQESQIGMLTAEIKEKEREIQENEEGWINFWNEQIKYNNFPWTGCSDSGTILKFCKGCDFELVCSGSMRPTFSCENTLYFCKARKDEIKMGDIIAFLTPNGDFETFYTIHRVINITDRGYVTRGDNALYPDEFIVLYNNIRGKLYKIEG